MKHILKLLKKIFNSIITVTYNTYLVFFVQFML